MTHTHSVWNWTTLNVYANHWRKLNKSSVRQTVSKKKLYLWLKVSAFASIVQALLLNIDLVTMFNPLLSERIQKSSEECRRYAEEITTKQHTEPHSWKFTAPLLIMHWQSRWQWTTIMHHILHKLASTDVKASSVGGSCTWRALRHSLICPCQPLVLEVLYLSGVTGSVGFLSHL